MSPWTREPTVTISPFRISKAIGYSRKSSLPSSMNLDSHLLAIFFHLLPILSHFAQRLGQLPPGNRRPSRWFFNHADAVFDRTNVKAQPAAYTIHLSHMNTGPRI